MFGGIEKMVDRVPNAAVNGSCPLRAGRTVDAFSTTLMRQCRMRNQNRRIRTIVPGGKAADRAFINNVGAMASLPICGLPNRKLNLALSKECCAETAAIVPLQPGDEVQPMSMAVVGKHLSRRRVQQAAQPSGRDMVGYYAVPESRFPARTALNSWTARRERSWQGDVRPAGY